jgi:hypothetical protein
MSYSTYTSPIDRMGAIAQVGGEVQRQNIVAQEQPIRKGLLAGQAHTQTLNNLSQKQQIQMVDKKLKETDFAANAYEALLAPDDTTMLGIIQQRMPDFLAAAQQEQATPDAIRERLNGLVQRGAALGVIQLPQPKQTNLQKAEGVDAQDNPIMGAFDPASGQYVNPQTQQPFAAGEFKPAPKAGQTINNVIPGEKQQNEFGKVLAQKGAEQFAERYSKAESARSSINSTIEAEKLLNSGAITGFGSQFLTSFGKALNQIGFSVAEDSIANTEAYLSSQATQVAEIIKAFGAGTGLSDKDREFAEKAAGANVSMSEGSLRYVLDINRRRYRTLISDVNKKLESIPKEYRPFLNPIEMPNVPGFSEKESVEDRIKTLSTFNRGVDPSDMQFATPEAVKRQLKQEGYDVSKLDNDEITRLLVGGSQPSPTESSNSGNKVIEVDW